MIRPTQYAKNKHTAHTGLQNYTLLVLFRSYAVKSKCVRIDIMAVTEQAGLSQTNSGIKTIKS